MLRLVKFSVFVAILCFRQTLFALQTDITGIDTFKSTSTISSSSSEASTNDQKSTTDSVPSVSVATSQEPDSEKCERNLCKNGGSCIKTKDGEVCTCQYPYAGRTCEDSYWCSEGLGMKCPDGKCRFNFTSGVGSCECPKGNYFNYDKGKCESTDPCVLMTKKCSGWREVCKNGKCECEENFKRNDKNECVANFCSSKPCGENEVCEDILDDPGQVRCTCKEGYTFDGEKCQKSNECSLVGGLGCQHICNAAKKECECYPGFTLQADKKSCSPNDARSTCEKDCGAGVCVQSKSEEKCVCPRTHISIGSTCIDLCTAKQLPPGLCPENLCEADEKNGFRCKCEGKFELDKNGITCKKAQMCYAKGGSHVCYKSNAVCVEDFNSTEGYHCKCRQGQEFDQNGRCRSKCDLDSYKEKCNKLSAVCEMTGDEAICKCLPMLTFGADGRCTEFAKSSYVGALPIAKYNYESAFASTPRIPGDYAALRKDIRDAMQLLHGENYKFADLVSCTSDFPILNCTVEIQFKSDPKSQVQIMGDPKICVNNDERTCVIPPRLVLMKDENHPVMFSPSDPCMKEIKDVNCGTGSTCSRAKDGSQNFVCQCGEGFISNGAVQPLSDKQTIIAICEDINECLYPKACPSKTICLNTIGSYECLCPPGYRPASLTDDVKKTGCVEMCDPKFCKHGHCEINDNMFRCKCDEGYTGLNCDEEYFNQDTINGLKIAIIVLSSIILPLTFLLIYLIHKYRMLKRKNNKSSSMDEPNTFSMHQWR